MKKSFDDSAKEISSNCKDPRKVLETMRRTMKASKQLIHAYYTIDLLKSLKKKSVGLNSVEQQAAKMCRGLPKARKDTIVNSVMDGKIKDASRKLNKERRDNTRTWRECKKILIEEQVIKQYIKLWRYEKKQLKKTFNQRRKKKMNHLVRKYKVKQEVPDDIEGIVIKDQEIPESFKMEPLCYGGCDIGKEEKELLMLPPKFAVYNNIDVISVEAQIEKGFIKYRWDKKSENRQEEENTSKETYFNHENKTFDMRNMRATDLPFNKRVVIPAAIDEKEELNLQHLKNRMLDTINAYVNDNKDKCWSNLTKAESKGIRSLKKRCKNQDISGL